MNSGTKKVPAAEFDAALRLSLRDSSLDPDIADQLSVGTSGFYLSSIQTLVFISSLQSYLNVDFSLERIYTESGGEYSRLIASLREQYQEMTSSLLPVRNT